MDRKIHRRAILLAASIAGPFVLVALFVIVRGYGFDTYSYWRVPHIGTDLYFGSTNPGGPPGTFRYSPAFAQLVSILWGLPWGAFVWVWIAINFTAYLLIVRKWWLVCLAFAPIPFELFDGNVHLLIALALVASFRWSGAWAFILLTKVTPGVGLAWYVVRREWRQLATAAAVTAGIAAVSAALFGPGLWIDWERSLASSSSADWTILGWIPLPVRIVIATGIVAWAARRDYRWLLPMAIVISLPSPWLHSFSILVATIPLAASGSRPAWLERIRSFWSPKLSWVRPT